MKEILNVLLIANNLRTCHNYIKHINTLSDVALLCITDNIDFAISLSKECQPDAIILDLELSQGINRGLLFLEELGKLSFSTKPYILITTSNTDTQLHEATRKLGADFILSKHQGDFSEKNSIEFLRLIKNAYQTFESSCGNYIKKIQQQIYQELDSIGISPKAIGYDYLADAILLLIQENCSNVCTALASRYSKSSFSISRAMQNAIDTAWKTMPAEHLLKNYTADIHSQRGIPTLSEFIHYYETKIKYG